MEIHALEIERAPEYNIKGTLYRKVTGSVS